MVNEKEETMVDYATVKLNHFLC